MEEDVSERFEKLGDKRTHLEPESMRRLYRAQLPPDDSQRMGNLLAKIAAIDRSRMRVEAMAERMAQEHQKQMAQLRSLTEKEIEKCRQEVKTAKEEKRHAEFAAARAHALSEARGSALLKKNAALEESRDQQVKLGEMLQAALVKLGYEFVPETDSPPVAPASPDTGRTSMVHWESGKRVDIVLPKSCDGDNDPFEGTDDLESKLRNHVGTDSHAILEMNEDEGHNGSETEKYCDEQSEYGDVEKEFVIYRNELSNTPSPHPKLPVQQLSDVNSSDSATKWKDISEAAIHSPSSNNGNDMNTPPSNVVPSEPTNFQISAENWAEQETQRLLAHLTQSQLESLVEYGNMAASGLITSPEMRQRVLEVVHQGKMHCGKNFNSNCMQSDNAKGNSMKTEAVRENNNHVYKACNTNGFNDSFDMPLGGSNAMYKNPIEALRARREGPLCQGVHKPNGVTADAKNKSDTNRDKSLGTTIYHGDKTSNGLIKAFSPPKKIVAHTRESALKNKQTHGLSVNDDFSRQRRAAERLMQKLNAKLPPEYRSEDPAAFGLRVSKNDIFMGTDRIPHQNEPPSLLEGSLRAEHSR